MDKSQDKSNIVSMIEPECKQQIQQALLAENFQQYRSLVTQMATELDIAMLDCAAALASINQQTLIAKKSQAREVNENRFDLPHKMLRYRIEVGRKHSVNEELLKQVLVEEAGVEKQMIGLTDIRFVFALIELPEGMPEDIFQHLKNVEINQQKLHIKRVNNKNQSKRYKGGYRRTRNGRNKKNTSVEKTANSKN